MRRVVVTGIGAVSPVGIGREAFWDALLAGRSGIGPVTSFDASRFKVRLGAEVRDFDPVPWCRRLDPAESARMVGFAFRSPDRLPVLFG